jgi:hypothetical protein
MDSILKLLLFISFFLIAYVGGIKSYTYLNDKIIGSNNGWALLAYTLLLFIVLGAIFFGSISALILIYTSLGNSKF